MKTTDEQRRAIGETERTVLLSAAAGSGKTSVLTERLCRMICRKENPLAVDRMLVVTFTNAAARTLYLRIEQSIDEALQKDPGNEALLRASLLLPAAKIKTIDSFCAELLRNNADKFGMAGHIRVLDTGEASVLQKTVMTALLEDAETGAFSHPDLDFVRVVDCLPPIGRKVTGGGNDFGRPAKDLVPVFIQLYEQLQCFPEGTDMTDGFIRNLEDAAQKPPAQTVYGKALLEQIREEASDYLTVFSAFARDMEEYPDTVEARNNKEECDSILRFLQAVLASLSDYEAARDVFSHFSFLKIGTAKNGERMPLPEWKEDFKAARADIRKWVEKECREKRFAYSEEEFTAVARQSVPVAKGISVLLKEYHRRFSAEKRERCLSDYNDLERFALAMLENPDRTPTPFARELSASFDAVCIDEYQDVNEIQHRIFEQISTPENRFMVGDIKQSIYGFRGARPDIFASLRQSYRPIPDEEADNDEKGAVETHDKGVLYLTKNFRSQKNVVDLCNGICNFLFQYAGASIGYQKEKDELHLGAASYPPQPLREPDGTPSPLFYLVCKEKKEEEEEEEDTVYSDEAEDKEEVKAVVSLVRRLLTEGKRVTGEPILPKDIAILLRGGKAKSKILCRALQKAGIAAHTEDKTSLFDLPEILLTLSLLHTVNNPHKDVYLAGLLRSPLYGFTMEDLVRIKKDRPRGETLYTSFCLYLAAHPDFEKGKRFAEDLEDFRFSAKNMPADGLLRYLWDKTDFVSAVPEENKPNLHLIYEYARQCEASGYHGLFRFLRFLDEHIKGGATESRTVGNPEGVTVGTVHGAKGLEYPVCILTDLMRSTPNRESPLLMHPSLGFGFRLRDETGLALFTTPFFRIVEKALYVGSAEEELRVLYVALTRAQEQLYFTMSVGRSTPETLLRKARLLKRFPTKTGILSANCFGNLILPNLPEDTVKAVIPPSVDDAAVLQIPERKTQPEAPAGEPDTGLFDLLKRQVSFTYPFAAETAMPRKLSVSALYPGFLDEKEADLPILTEDPVYEPPFFISHKEKDPGAKAGIATHLFLQFCRYENLKNPTLEKVEAEKNRLVRERFLPEKDGEKIRSAELMGFFRSEIFRSVLEASAVRREFRFHVKLPVTLFTETAREQFGKDTEVLVQGVIDLLTEDRNGKLHLFDYKTDRLPKEALADDEKAKTILLERYQNQLTYYALAVRCIFGKEPEEIKLFSLHTGKAYDVPPALPLTAFAEEERRGR